MKTLKKIVLSICLFLLMLLVNFGLSWIVTCGVWALICFCFGQEFSWLVATGVWLIYLLMKEMFKRES